VHGTSEHSHGIVRSDEGRCEREHRGDHQEDKAHQRGSVGDEAMNATPEG
jgi:hypothetical protein